LEALQECFEELGLFEAAVEGVGELIGAERLQMNSVAGEASTSQLILGQCIELAPQIAQHGVGLGPDGAHALGIFLMQWN
jgi:hypothetical protein